LQILSRKYPNLFVSPSRRLLSRAEEVLAAAVVKEDVVLAVVVTEEEEVLAAVVLENGLLLAMELARGSAADGGDDQDAATRSRWCSTFHMQYTIHTHDALLTCKIHCALYTCMLYCSLHFKIDQAVVLCACWNRI
jgi:hypothetical protein